MIKRLLFVDDEQNVLDALRRMLRPQRHEWEITCRNDPRRAWEELQNGAFDLVISDMAMPGMSGLELLDRIKRSPVLQELPVLMLTGLDTRQAKRQALELGAADLLNKPVDSEDLVARLRSMLRLKTYQDELKAHNAALEHRVQERTAELVRSRLEVIWRLGKAAEHRDNETGNHVIRVGCMSRIIADALGMDRDFVETLFVAAPLHDIGKIGIPDSVLAKPGPLTDAEWEVMKQHCRLGARILQEDTRAEAAFEQWLSRPGVPGSRAADNPVLQMAARVALMHHEKWDGGGYPNELAGEGIALEARIVAVADVFDALTSYRPYKAPYAEVEALQIMEDSARSHFDPAAYAAFRRSLPAIRSVREQFPDRACGTLVSEETCNEADLVCG
jgi:putative two-component system response regulator